MVKLVETEHPDCAVTVAEYTPGVMGPELAVMVLLLMPPGVGDHRIEYEGVDVSVGTNPRLRLKPFAVLVQVICESTGATVG